MRIPPMSIACLAIPLVVACGDDHSPSNAGASGGGRSSGSGGGAAKNGGASAGGFGVSGHAMGGSGLGGTAASSGGHDGGGASSDSGAGTAEGEGAGSGSALPPSCQSKGPGLSACGGDSESCCASVNVPGGTFYRTYENEGNGASGTADPATISDFRLDKYLVTVGRFRRFVTAWDQGSGYTPEPGSGKHEHLNGGKGLADSGASGAYEEGWLESYNGKIDLSNDSLDCLSNSSTWTSRPGANEQLPMNCINWFEAYAFCIWDGGFLPSEAEYVYAAAGGTEQRRFPWGATAPGKDNRYAIWGCNYPDGSGSCDGTIRNIAPVGTPKLGAGRWGQLDLVGEMIEWCLDYFAEAYSNPCTDCANLARGSGRAPREGYYGSTDEALLQSSYRNNGFYPSNRFNSYGFRCARPPVPP